MSDYRVTETESQAKPSPQPEKWPIRHVRPETGGAYRLCPALRAENPAPESVACVRQQDACGVIVVNCETPVAGPGRAAHVVAALGCVLCFSSTAASQPEAVTNPRALIPWLRAAATGRADAVCIGDSNQLQQNSGWDHGWTRILGERFGLYATGLLSCGENLGNGAGAGYQYSVGAAGFSGQFAYGGAPAPLDLFMQPGIGMSPFNYMYLAPGLVGGANVLHGLFIDAASGIDVNGPLRFSLVHGTFATGGPGSFQLVLRQGAPPFQNLAVGTSVPTVTGDMGVSVETLDIPAASRNIALNLRYSPIDQNIDGPFLGYYARAENLARPVGVSVHTLYAFGGQSARDMAAALRAADDDYLSLYFQRVRALQGAAPKVLIRINTGLNDRNENLPSVTLGIIPGNLSAAFDDNMRTLIARVREIWTLNAWPQEELFFLITVSHPVWNPDDYMLESYREIASNIALSEPQCAAVNFNLLTSWGEMVANSWYQFGGIDPHHLTVAGYENLSRRELAAIEDGACWRDLNADRLINAEDLYEWYRATPDLDGDGVGSYLDQRCLERAVRADEPLDQAAGAAAPPPLP